MAFFAQGTKLQVSDGATPTPAFTTVFEALSISGPGMTADVIDVTSHSSTGGFREFIGGLKDGGEVTFDVNLSPQHVTHNDTSATGLRKLLQDGTVRAFKMIYTDTGNSEDTFNGVVVGFEVSAPVDSQLMASMTIKITGPVTLA